MWSWGVRHFETVVLIGKFAMYLTQSSMYFFSGTRNIEKSGFHSLRDDPPVNCKRSKFSLQKKGLRMDHGSTG